MALNPGDSGYQFFYNVIVGTSEAVCHAYGVYLGNLLKSQPNVMWLSGNDYQWSTGNDALILSGIAEGIASVAPNQLQSVEILGPNPGNDSAPNISSDDSAWPTAFPSTFINGAYTYYSPYPQILQAYNADVGPAYGLEYNYEDENNSGSNYGSPFACRAQSYWTMCSGATGTTFCNHYTWGFISGWESNLDTPGAIQTGYMAALFKSIAWQNLVPDQGHTFITAGYGTNGSGDEAIDTYVASGVDAAGTIGVAYIPQGGAITVAMTKMSATTTARWYDPTIGAYTAISGSPFANTGTHSFTPPTAAHSDGTHDWVLVLTA